MSDLWGCCSEDGQITFASKLLDMPDDFQEVVVVHELLHLVIYDHGTKFQQLMLKHLPNCREVGLREAAMPAMHDQPESARTRCNHQLGSTTSSTQARRMATEGTDAAPLEVSKRILVLRGQRVLLDSDLAALYGVKTLRLNEQVRRNADRFPDDFLLVLTNQELASLRSQFAILKTGRGQHRKYPPLAFTEHGAVMAATILNSARAAAMSVYIVRAFVRMRTMLEGNAQLARKLDALEKSVAVLDADTRRQFKELRAVVFALAAPPTGEQ